MIERLKPIARVAAVGLLAVGCGTSRSESNVSVENTRLESDHSLILKRGQHDFLRLVRINEHLFLVTDDDLGSSSTGTVASPGVDYMRRRGCTIMDVLPVNASTAKVIVTNGSDCLPELK